MSDLANIKSQFAEHVKDLQNQISDAMKKLDPKLEVTQDIWKRQDFEGNDGGGGITRAFAGDLFENAGVNTSLVHGKINPDFAAKLGSPKDNNMWATGISLIIHPRNPRVPTVHANFRMIEAGEKCWFGGGADLTPFYPNKEDFIYFHETWKRACEPYGCYADMKKQCDDYFVNFHRNNEMRGIGGIFFDHFSTGDWFKDMSMVKDLSSYFIESYFPLVEKRMNESFTPEDEEFQLHRRGRYVEFNLLHDRGTAFGLKTNGRTDSILISLPARCKFTYAYGPADGTPHAEMMEYYRPYDWV